MKNEVDFRDLGEELGVQAADQTTAIVNDMCGYERQRIERTNQGRIEALTLEGQRLEKERELLEERIRRTPPPSENRFRNFDIAYHGIVALVLMLSGYMSYVLAFDPFEFGWKAYQYSAGAAIVTLFLVELYLRYNQNQKALKIIGGGALVVALIGLVLLAIIRGDILAQKLQQLAPALTFDDAAGVPPPASDFYQRTDVLIRIVMATIAIAMEIGSGLAIYELRQLLNRPGVSIESLLAARVMLERQMIATREQICNLSLQGIIFEVTFKRDFCRSLLRRVVQNHSAFLKVLVVGFAVTTLLLTGSHAALAEPLNLVIAIDLSRSVDVAGPDQQTEFQKNIAGITKVLATVPAGSHVTIIGITDQSFQLPYTIMAAQLSPDEGYFKEKIAAARQQLVSAWKAKSAKLQPSFPGTDIIGALLVAAEIFNRDTAERRVLVIFSDMRQNTPELTLAMINGTSSLTDGLRLVHPLADLHAVSVDVLGVDAAGLSVAAWNQLRKFWAEYFKSANAELSTFSILRDFRETQPPSK